MVSKEIMKILDILQDWKSESEIFKMLDIGRPSLRKALQQLSKLKLIHEKPLAKEDRNNSHGPAWDPIELAMQRQRSHGGPMLLSARIGKSPDPIKHIKGIHTCILPKVNQKNKRALLDALEERKSVRDYGNTPITITGLSYFLYHCARIKKMLKKDKLTQRPYPSGGARYPLEIYVMNNRITGIQKGIYYYDPLRHRLLLLNKNKTSQGKFNQFLIEAQKPLMPKVPDVVLIITAVFNRTMWKYKNIGLSLILSDLGCLYQTMYLVATEMKLAPCPLGLTNEALVRDWLNLNWFEESHVGTFMLGNQ